MKDIEFHPEVLKKLRIIKRKQPNIYKKIKKQLILFQDNPKHKSLRLHKIKQGGDTVWSISINMSLRMIYKETEIIYITNIGTHDEVYKK